jgi:hypothetical protein
LKDSIKTDPPKELFITFNQSATSNAWWRYLNIAGNFGLMISIIKKDDVVWDNKFILAYG